MYGGLHYSTPVTCVNRFCASGLEAIAIIASKIKAGHIDCGIGAGVENMGIYSMTGVVAIDKMDRKCFKKEFKGVLTTMGRTSENVAAKYNISR